MRIIHIYDGHERVLPGEGSVPTVVYYVAKYTAKKGHEVMILERKWKGLNSEEEIDGIKFNRINLTVGSDIPYKEIPYEEIKKPKGVIRLILSRYEFAIKVNEILKQEDFDVVHVHLPFAANILATFNRNIRKRLIYTLHIGQEEVRLSKLIKNRGQCKKVPLVLRMFSPDLYLMKRANSLTVMHEKLAKILIQHGFNNVHVIPHGIDISEFTNTDTMNLNIVRKKYFSDNKITILFATTITPHKGVEYLVKAANILINKENIRNIKFILAGNASLDVNFVGKIKNYIQQKDLYRNVIITGFVPYEELRGLYLMSDIFVYPLLGYGGVSIGILEAMAAGLPIIATPIGGLPMQVLDGWNGFLVKPKNEQELAEKLKYLVENGKERRKMGKNSRKLVEEKFSWEIITEKYLDVYEKIAKK